MMYHMSDIKASCISASWKQFSYIHRQLYTAVSTLIPCTVLNFRLPPQLVFFYLILLLLPPIPFHSRGWRRASEGWN